eukprot:6187170-Pleurochrysis_carterae.AAC.3
MLRGAGVSVRFVCGLAQASISVRMIPRQESALCASFHCDFECERVDVRVPSRSCERSCGRRRAARIAYRDTHAFAPV